MNSPISNDEVNKWKDKYYNLLDDQEKNDQLILEKESLLNKIISRLAHASKGYNEKLDPHLQRIQELIKADTSVDKLKQELNSFSDSLLHLTDDSGENNNPQDVILLFEFLEQLYPDHPYHQELQKLQENTRHQKIIDRQNLLKSIISITQPSSVPQVNVSEANTTNLIDTDIVGHQLLHLLEDTEIPANYDSQADHLKDRLQTELDTDAFQTVLEESVALLLNIEQHVLSEQEEIEDFLSSITQRLTELNEQASGASAASQENAITRNKLNQSVSRQMKDLQQSSENATKLDPLKQLITTSLESISRQINEHQREEGQQRLETHDQLLEMAAKIQTMETESRDLKYKLQIAHDKALRDPLTGLPNRLAYEERLATEVARWHRYQTPLTMTIWDIDYFKQINDNYGHKAGDKTLLLIAGLFTKNCRQTDFVARFGGEEFIMLLPDTSKESGLIVAEKIRSIIEKSGFNAGGKAVSITISCGITQYIDTDSFDSLFDRADKALYLAKSKGRNQCMVN